jgi:hypothetical protein
VVTGNLNENGLDLVDGEKVSKTSLVAAAEVQVFLRTKLVRRGLITDFPRSPYLVSQDRLMFPLLARKLAWSGESEPVEDFWGRVPCFGVMLRAEGHRRDRGGSRLSTKCKANPE